MAWFLNVVYLVALLFSIPWQMWRAVVQRKSRRGWSQKLFGRAPRKTGDSPTIWLHAVSVGEVMLAETVAKELRHRFPDHDIRVSTSTETGYDLAVQKFGPASVFFFPFDFTWAVSNVFRRLQPRLLLLMELEVWPNLIQAASRFQTPVVVANGRLSESSFSGYQKFESILKPVFQGLTQVACQTEEYANRFRQLGAPNVMISGNIKFDGTETNRDNEQTKRLATLTPWHRDNSPTSEFVWVAGSTQPEEDEIIAAVFSQLSREWPQLKLVIAPRHLQNVPNLVSVLANRGLAYQLRSEIPDGQDAPASTTGTPASVLVIDVIGELKYWWGIGDAAYVGGSMGSRGGQNMIEPAGFGLPLAFGPNTQNFREVVQQLQESAAAVVVNDESELTEFVQNCFSKPDWAADLGGKAKAVVLKNQGALGKTVSMLQDLLRKQ